MIQKFKQIIYFNETSSFNTSGVTKNTLMSGSAFEDYLPACQLGIQALPGTKVYLNGNANPIIIGFTGVFSIDLSAGGNITEITVDATSLNLINDNINAFLIIDIAYFGGD